MPAIDLSKLRKVVEKEIPHVLTDVLSFPRDAQPKRLDEQERFKPLQQSERPGLMVSVRTEREVRESGAASASAMYRNGLIMFYGGQLPDNRFMMRFYKNPWGPGVTAIPQLQNLLQHLPNWEFGTRGPDDIFGYISVDIVGMIYLKSHFP